MANEIKIANAATPTDVISAAISRPLVDKVVCIQHVFAEGLPVGTPVKKARKDAALGLGATVTEASNYTFGSDSEFTQSSVSLTAAKTVIASKITEEAKQFTTITDQDIINKQGNSLARTLDNAVKLLATGWAQTITTANPLLIEDVMECAYLIRAGYANEDGRRLVAILDYKGVHQLGLQAVASSASAFVAPEMLAVLMGLRNPNGFVAPIPGADVYEVGGLPTGGGYRSGMVINPALAMFGIYGPVQVLRKNPDSQGLFTELTSYVFNQVAEWNDAAGIQLKSPQ